MKEGNTQLYSWQFKLKAAPTVLWPYVSDTNRLLRKLGASPVQQTALSRNTPKGFSELSLATKNSYTSWQEEPYIWEMPYRFGVKRHYKLGILSELTFSVDLNSTDDGTKLNFKIHALPSKFAFSFLVRFYIDSFVKRRLSQFLSELDASLSQNVKPYELQKKSKLGRGAEKRLADISGKLSKATKRNRIVNRLSEFLHYADNEDLQRIHPYALAEYWGEKKYSVLNVFLNAVNLELLDFSWDVCCPTCKSPKHSFQKMQEARVHLYCDECEADYEMDFNRNMYLVFHPHPLIRKVKDKTYCLGGPGTKPHRVIQQHLGIGDERYPQVQLQEGTYHFQSHEHNGYLVLHARENGDDNINIYITDEDLNGQDIEVSLNPNLIISNRSSNKVTCFIDKLNWKEEAIYASEVSSSHDFRELFSRETLKETSKVQASEVTMLFTDLMNSTELYLQEGDESAIGRVMGHFKTIQQIVAEERGGIVKTIGDSVMAVFWEPVSAIKAVHRIQQIFTTSTSMGNSFKLKAGVHFGDCTAVNLNGRIDYFGTTVNIAARMVDVASEKEIMVSEAVFNHPDVQLYLDKNSDSFFVKESMKELKGFEDEEFKVKQIRLERPPMRLVI